MKKKIMALLITAVMAISLCGCGDSASDSGSTPGGVSGGQEAGSADEDGKTETSGSTGEVSLEALMAHEESPAEDFDYVLVHDVETDRDVVRIHGYIGNDSIVVIPDEIDGVPVISADAIFATGSGLNVEAVRYNDNITSIPRFAFSAAGGETNDSIKYIVLGENMRTISELAFSNCPQLEYIQLNDNLETIAATAFSYSSISDITLPDGLRDYTVSAFSGMNVHVSAGSEAEAYLNEIAENGDEYGNDLEYWNITVIVE